MPLTTVNLDTMVAGGCQEPGCKDPHHDGLWLVQHCHPSKGLEVFYNTKNKTVEIRCWVCDKPVCVIKVENPIEK